MKITIYELLGLVKDDKAPKRIMYNDIVWDYIEIEGDYRSRHNNKLFFNDEINNTWIMTHLNTTAEIIEEPQEHKIPKKLNLDTDKLRGKETPRTIDYLIEDKINEILDYLEEIEQKRKNK